MHPYIATVFSVAACSMVLLACGSLFVRANKGELLPVDVQGTVGAAVSLTLGVIATALFVINVNLWFPGKWVYHGLVALGACGLLRLVVLRRSGGAEILVWLLILTTAVAAVAYGVGLRVDAANYWLVETSNHDTLFYFEGARWAVNHPIFVGPDVVSEALHLGGCELGAVYIGNDCPVYRGGSYSMLGMAMAYGAGSAANDMLIASALGALFIGVGLLPVAAMGRLSAAQWRYLWLPLLALLVVVVYFSPSMLAAAINSNVATTIGASAAAMVLALATTIDRCWWRRALTLGLGASLAAHCYGEAAAAAVVFAAFGVVACALIHRSWRTFFMGAALCAGAFFIASNVLLGELLQSASDVEGIASGGTWEGMYLHASPWTWFAAPFAGMVVNGSPYVSPAMLLIGWLLALFVGFGSLSLKSMRPALLGLLSVSLLLVGFVELRDYAYGEHKVVQMIGPAACVLAAALLLNMFKVLGEARRGKWQRWGILAYSVVLLLLMLAAIQKQAPASMRVVEGWKGVHGLSLDFDRDLPGASSRAWVIDDTGVQGMERFQKSHYIAYLAHERNSRVYLPKLDQEGMRGGYARLALGDTLKSATDPRWVVQLKSFTGVQSPFKYAPESIKPSTEYNLVDLSKAGPVVAVSGWGWLACQAEGCPVASGFEIEALVSADQGGDCHLTLHADHAAEYPSLEVIIDAGNARLQPHRLAPEGIDIPLVAGWQRITFTDPNATPGAIWVVHEVTSSCAGTASVQ